MVLGAKGAPITGEQSVVQSRRDDEAMQSIVEEEQRRVGGGGPPRMVCDLSRAPLGRSGKDRHAAQMQELSAHRDS